MIFLLNAYSITRTIVHSSLVSPSVITKITKFFGKEKIRQYFLHTTYDYISKYVRMYV